MTSSNDTRTQMAAKKAKAKIIRKLKKNKQAKRQEGAIPEAIKEHLPETRRTQVVAWLLPSSNWP